MAHRLVVLTALVIGSMSFMTMGCSSQDDEIVGYEKKSNKEGEPKQIVKAETKPRASGIKPIRPEFDMELAVRSADEPKQAVQTIRAIDDADDWPRRNPTEISALPIHVEAPKGKLTLYADFDDVRGDQIAVYLVNRTESPIVVEHQDGDIYVKLEFKNDEGKWIRAQSHTFSWCGNSYMFPPKLKRNQYMRFAGYLPSKGEVREVRYRRYAGDNKLVSNVSNGRIDPVEVKVASQDRIAISTGDLSFVLGIATGKTLVTNKDFVDPRSAAVGALAQKRFKREDVVPILKKLSKDSNAGIAFRAQYAIRLIEERNK